MMNLMMIGKENDFVFHFCFVYGGSSDLKNKAFFFFFLSLLINEKGNDL